MISQYDVDARDVLDGDRVQVANDCGAFKAVARITDDVKAGIVVATLDYWRQLNQGTVNSISLGAFTDMGHAPSFSDNLARSRARTEVGARMLSQNLGTARHPRAVPRLLAFSQARRRTLNRLHVTAHKRAGLSWRVKRH